MHMQLGHRSILDDPYYFGMAVARMVFMMVFGVLWLWTIMKVADAFVLKSELKTLDKVGDAFTDEERDVLVRKIKMHALKG